MAELIVVPYTVHLKMKYYTTKGKVATLHGDIKVARIYFDGSNKGLSSIKVAPRQETKLLLPTSSKVPKTLPLIDIVDLDNHFCREAEAKVEVKNSSTNKNENSIRTDLPDLAKKQLKACLRENVDLFTWSAADMPALNPEVSFHHLTIDPACKAISQTKRTLSPKKTVATELAVKDILEVNFILEAKYTTCLSNFVLVKKNNRKLRM